MTMDTIRGLKMDSVYFRFQMESGVYKQEQKQEG